MNVKTTIARIAAADDRLGDKLARLADLGLPKDKLVPVIYGTGNSPRRARRAIRCGLGDLFATAYLSAITSGMSHDDAVAQCGRLFMAQIGEPMQAAIKECA